MNANELDTETRAALVRIIQRAARRGRLIREQQAAADLDMWDTPAWVESQVLGGYMSPSWARVVEGYCPQWLATEARERFGREFVVA